MHRLIHCWMKRWNQPLKRVGQPLLLLFVVAIISACGVTIVDHRQPTTPESSSTSCRVVQHSMGKTCIPNNPKRVVTISRAVLSNALALGIRPIGTSVWGIEELRTFLTHKSFLGSEVEDITNVGFLYEVNLEKILSLKPDLILAWEPTVENNYSQLSQIAPTVAIPSDDLVTDWEKGFETTAEILGKQPEAQKVREHYNRRTEALRIALGEHYKNKTISVGGVYNQNIFMYVKNSFIGSILEDVGLQRPASQQINTSSGSVSNISEENLNLLDGDILFILGSSFGHTESYEALQQKPLWQTLEAAKSGNVYLVDTFAWTTESPLAADAVIDDLYKYLVETPLSEN